MQQNGIDGLSEHIALLASGIELIFTALRSKAENYLATQ
jgi:hypothetical protein